MKNNFAISAVQAELNGWNEEQIKELFGTNRERLGIFEDDEIESELEAGQSSGLVNEILTVKELFQKLLNETSEAQRNINLLYR